MEFNKHKKTCCRFFFEPCFHRAKIYQTKKLFFGVIGKALFSIWRKQTAEKIEKHCPPFWYVTMGQVTQWMREIPDSPRTAHEMVKLMLLGQVFFGGKRD